MADCQRDIRPPSDCRTGGAGVFCFGPNVNTSASKLLYDHLIVFLIFQRSDEKISLCIKLYVQMRLPALIIIGMDRLVIGLILLKKEEGPVKKFVPSKKNFYFEKEESL